jgi:coniferyl-aldehyde dehydrogenase
MNPLLFDFEQMQQAFMLEPYADIETRRNRIKRIMTMLNENEENLCKVIDADFGYRQPVETQLAEIIGIRQAATFALRQLNQWMKPVKVKTPFHLQPSQSFLLPQPKGVIGIMSPWNYPLCLALIPAISALAAGNRVLIKPSERSPRTSGYLATLVAQYFHPTELTIINGGPQTAEYFAGLPFAHLLFTGSTSVGQSVAKAAAENLTPLTLELGGKSPVIIDPSASLKDCVSRILYGKLFNNGQTCIAPDYIMVPHSMKDELIEKMKDSYMKMYENTTQRTHAIDDRQVQRWQDLLQDAKNKGATIVPLSNEEIHHQMIVPSLVVDAISTSKVMTEEIFGPILPIIAYSDLSEAIAFIRSKPHPLAMYWFGSKEDRLRSLLEQTQAGGVCINDTLLHYNNHFLPFGGIGQSGMGSYHGKYGFDTFTHYKPIFKTKGFLGLMSLAGTKIIHPPYGKKVEKLMKTLGKS